MPQIEHLEIVRRLTRVFGQRLPYDAMQLRWYDALLAAGDGAIDVGAHDGRHSARMANLVGDSGNVMSVEPLPDQANHLRARFSDRSSLEIHETALSDSSGEVEFFVCDGALEESGLRQRELRNPDAGPFRSITVQVSTLDSLTSGMETLSLLKIDVEGAEMSVLRGARELIARTRPVIFVEYGVSAYGTYGTQHADLFDWAATRDYAIYDLFGVRYSDRAEWINAPSGLVWDYVLTPEEDEERISALFRP